MNSKKKIILIFSFVLLDIVLIAGFFFIRSMTLMNQLQKEINELSKLDITKDRYNRDIVTDGGYRIVEEAIKDYLDDYALILQELSNMVSDPQLNNILSYDTIERESPDFDESLKYLDDFSVQYNEKVDYLLSRLKEKTIRDFINDRTNSKYYRNLYYKLMLQNDAWVDFFQTKEVLMNSRTYVNQFCNSSIEALRFLKDHQGTWVLENGEVKFQNSEDYEIYSNILSKIKS